MPNVRKVFKAENLLVDVLGTTEVGGVTRVRIRDAQNKKADIRTVLEFALREPTEEDLQDVFYLYTDEETGEVHELVLQKEFINAIPTFLGFSKLAARTTKSVLADMVKPDTDSTRRQFRAAVAYWIERGVVVCSNSNGYFIAETAEEVESCVKNKERQANANLKRAKLLRSMDIEKSTSLFVTQVGKNKDQQCPTYSLPATSITDTITLCAAGVM
jgi:hypothetical protein